MTDISRVEKKGPARPSHANYLDVLPTAIADMADAVLTPQSGPFPGLNFPVHKAMLVANSAVFAEIFLQEEASMPEIPMPGDSLWDVYTALKYLYAGYSPHGTATTSSPDIKSVLRLSSDLLTNTP